VRIPKSKQKLQISKYLIMIGVNSSQHIVVAKTTPPPLQQCSRGPLYVVLGGESFHATLGSHTSHDGKVNRVPNHRESPLNRSNSEIFIYTTEHVRETHHLHREPAEVIFSRGLTSWSSMKINPQRSEHCAHTTRVVLPGVGQAYPQNSSVASRHGSHINATSLGTLDLRLQISNSLLSLGTKLRALFLQIFTMIMKVIAFS
jgi:hypothetical protein